FSASFFVLWAVGVVHTAIDARRRFANPSACVVWLALAAMLPLAGPCAYLLVRPSETREERRLRRRRLLCLELALEQPREAAPARAPRTVAPRRMANRSFEAQPAAR